MKRKSISDSRSTENNSDKRFQKWGLFNQHRLMREPQVTWLLIGQVRSRLSCVEITIITTFMRQFRKSCNGWQKVSAGLTIVANATGLALLRAPRSSVINLIRYIIYKKLFSLRSQYFAKFARSSKRRFSIERCLCPEIHVWFFCTVT